MKALVWDMDGTLVDFYGVEGWLDSLRNFSTRPYDEAKPLWPTNELNHLMTQAQNQGYTIIICTALAKCTTTTFNKAVRNSKKVSLAAMAFPYNNFRSIPYGGNKYYPIKNIASKKGDIIEEAILFDDDMGNRQQFEKYTNCKAVNPMEVNIIEYLKKLLEKS